MSSAVVSTPLENSTILKYDLCSVVSPMLAMQWVPNKEAAVFYFVRIFLNAKNCEQINSMDTDDPR